MDSTVKEVMQFIAQNDVKFIRLAFCDLLGTQKNISIMPAELERAFCDGVSIDGSNIAGFTSVDRSDLLLFPDPATVCVLPWRPQQGRVVRFYCHIRYPDATPYPFDARAILKQAVRRCEQAGYSPQIGTECEFYLFRTDENGFPLEEPFDNGGYLDVAPMDKGENVRREICLCLEDMGLHPESSHHESGPGQNEIDFRYGDALMAADNLITFKSVVKAIAARNGLFASFLPKPIGGKSGSGLHLNLSLNRNGHNIFRGDDKGGAEAESFIAGILEAVTGITALLNPLENSYERFGRWEAPKYVSWSRQNRSQLIRIPSAVGEKTRMELRSADCTANPYLAFASLLCAGMDGIESKMTLPAEVPYDLYRADSSVTAALRTLPTDLSSALDALDHSETARKALGDEVVDRYIAIKHAELEESGDPGMFRRLFERF